MKKIQNLADSLTTNASAFTLPYDTCKSHNKPFLIEEFYITETVVDDYTIRIAVLDEDQNPILAGDVDIYDVMGEAKLQLAYVASLISVGGRNSSDAQVRALLDTYELFDSSAQYPADNEDFDDLRTVQQVMRFVLHTGKDADEFFAVPAARRKTTPMDYSKSRFRAVATEIVRKFQAV